MDLSLTYVHVVFITVLLQHGADPNIRNTDGKTPLDLADPSAKSVLIGMLLVFLPKLLEKVCDCHAEMCTICIV